MQVTELQRNFDHITFDGFVTTTCCSFVTSKILSQTNLSASPSLIHHYFSLQLNICCLRPYGDRRFLSPGRRMLTFCNGVATEVVVTIWQYFCSEWNVIFISLPLHAMRIGRLMSFFILTRYSS